LVKKPFWKNTFVRISNEDKVGLLSDKAVGLFNGLKEVHNELRSINSELQVVVVEEEKNKEIELERHRRKMEDINNNIENAQDEIKMNLAIQSKLDEFVWH
jgi:hypothetical protein